MHEPSGLKQQLFYLLRTGTWAEYSFVATAGNRVTARGADAEKGGLQRTVIDCSWHVGSEPGVFGT